MSDPHRDFLIACQLSAGLALVAFLILIAKAMGITP